MATRLIIDFTYIQPIHELATTVRRSVLGFFLSFPSSTHLAINASYEIPVSVTPSQVHIQVFQVSHKLLTYLFLEKLSNFFFDAPGCSFSFLVPNQVPLSTSFGSYHFERRLHTTPNITFINFCNRLHRPCKPNILGVIRFAPLMWSFCWTSRLDFQPSPLSLTETTGIRHNGGYLVHTIRS